MCERGGYNIEPSPSALSPPPPIFSGSRNPKHNAFVNVLHLHSTFWSKTSMAHEQVFYLYVQIRKLVGGFLKIYQEDLLLLKEILGSHSVISHEVLSFVRLTFLIQRVRD